MGNCACCMAMGTKTIQLVRPDGTVEILRKPVTAGQIMQGLPQHLVCHSDSFFIGQRTAALSENDVLQMEKKYFVLPELFFQSELTLVSIASILSAPSPLTPTTGVSAAPLRSIERASAHCEPFEIESGVDGRRRIRVSPQFITKIMEDGRINIDERGHAVERDSTANENRLCNTPDLQKDYEKLVKPKDRSWRPKLDTIKEEN
jgi:hypothetical protein